MESPFQLLEHALALQSGQSPFPWQQRLLTSLLEGKLPRALDLPTGLGKTSVLAIWLVARAAGADLPRRLVYVVDRRAVVDQSTRVAEELRAWVESAPAVQRALGLHGRRLPISTLRGQFVDNREWLDDPASPAIIVGTVDMIGSRLLFEGYGVSRKMRPYQAGLLGADTLFVLDESHLVPAFERLIEQVCALTATEASASPPVRLLSLSATGRAHATAFALDEDDLAHPDVDQRYRATKRVEVRPAVVDKNIPTQLAEEAWALAESSEGPVRLLVFCSSRDHAQKAKKALDDRGRKAGPAGRPTPETELFVGARRVHERQAASDRLVELGFLAGSQEPIASDAFLFATAAGEVGVDLDADHMVSDVVAWERMVQRLGRVNRRGEKQAVVVVVPTADRKPPAEGLQTADLDAVEHLLRDLPTTDDGHTSASPKSLDTLRRAEDNRGRIDAATTPEPLHPPLSLPLLESWAMTSLREHTGRPEVTPWLRGWVEQRPQTRVVWRRHLPPSKHALEALLGAAPPHLAETVTGETWQVADWLLQLWKRLEGGDTDTPTLRFIVLDGRGELVEFIEDPTRTSRKGLETRLSEKTLLLNGSLGGLASDGLLDASSTDRVPCADDEGGWFASGTESPEVPWRVDLVRETAQTDAIPDEWSIREEIPVSAVEQTLVPIADEPTHLLRVLRWRTDAATEEDRSIARSEQTLVEHQDWAGSQAATLSDRLRLSPSLGRLIELAAKLHDEGKRARIWQQAFSAPPGEAYAKTRGPVRPAMLAGYRHEFGSLACVDEHAELRALSPEDRDLVLHLIASHHGWARPNIQWKGSEFEAPSRAQERARAVALRYTRVQARFGVWGLAYLEALLRAADQQASRRLEEENR